MGSRTRMLIAATTRMLELDRESVPLNVIHRQLGHANLRTTFIYLQGINPEEISATVHMRPMMSASAGPRL
jgi:integrase